MPAPQALLACGENRDQFVGFSQQARAGVSVAKRLRLREPKPEVGFATLSQNDFIFRREVPSAVRSLCLFAVSAD